MKPSTLVSLIILGSLSLSASNVAAQLQSPEEFLGHRLGADYRLVKWPRIVQYFEHLDANSDRITVRELGTTTEGRPFIFAEISDAATIAKTAWARCIRSASGPASSA